MDMLATRARRSRLALLIASTALLGACADDPTGVTTPPTGLRPNLAVGDVITVTSRSGGTDVGSLRWAVAQATGGETIRFAPELAGQTIVLDGTISVMKHVTIEGDATRGITLSGAGRFVVLYAFQGVKLRNMNITDGYGFEGAGILSVGPLTLEHVTVYNNLGTAGAGGIFAATEATLINSTVAYNEGPYVAGIGYNFTGGKLTLINSTVAYNTPGRGLSAGGPTTTAPVVTLQNSIISGNGNGSTHFNCNTTWGFTYQGRNLSNDATCGSGTGMTVAIPVLNTIADNGGPSLTMKLHRLSPAINAGSSCTTAVDQRYVARDAKCDIGAYEFTEFNTVTLTIDPNVTVYKNEGYVVVKGTAKCTYADANSTGFTLQLQQRNKQVTRNASFLCSTTAQPWSLALETAAAGITTGSATITVATTDTPAWYIPASASRSIKLAAK